MPATATTSSETRMERTPTEAVIETQADSTQPVFEPVRPWMTHEQMEALASKQPLLSWEEKCEQINQSLGRPQGSR
jgi:hypothetical protein